MTKSAAVDVSISKASLCTDILGSSDRTREARLTSLASVLTLTDGVGDSLAIEPCIYGLLEG